MGRIDQYLAAMQRLGVAPKLAAPPLWRFAWRHGVPLRPVLYWPGWAIAAFYTLAWGIPMLAVMALTEPFRPRALPLVYVAALVAGVSLLEGTLAALYYRIKARRLHLSTWGT